MHRLFAPFLAIAVLLAALAPVSGHATDADNKGIKLEFDAAVLQRMSAFVSAFSEIDPQGRWHRIDDASQADSKFLITLGVLHNWMHNAAAFAVDGGKASIDAAAVAATIEEYTGQKFDSHAAVPESGISFADGRYAIAADTPKEGPQAVVTSVFATPDNGLVMVGHVADKQAPDGVQGGAQAEDDLQVRVAHHTWKGKDRWRLLSWAWAGKPAAKPVEQPAELPKEQAAEVPTEQPITSPAVQPETGTEPVTAPAPTEVPETAPTPADETSDKPATADVPAVAPVVPTEQPATEANQAPQAEQEPAPAPQPEPVGTPEAQPAQENTPEAKPAVTPEGQTAPESAPATPTENAGDPAVEPEPQPEPQAEPQPKPVTAPEAQPAPEVIPAPQPETEPVAQTVIPFTASTEPDFSEVLAIAVPAGWNHRNAEGVLELTNEAQDAWLVVEATRLGKRDPQKALKVFSGGAVLTPYGDSGATYVFTSEGSTGRREHMIVVDADANLVCRLTWQAAETYRDAITAILHGLRVNGRAVAS